MPQQCNSKDNLAIGRSAVEDDLRHLCTQVEVVGKAVEVVGKAVEVMGKAIESLQTENQTENQEIKKRLTYLEYDLHAENKHLRDENFGRRQEVDYASEDYCSNEDSCEREYSEERRGR